MDIITITEIALPVFIGVYPQERATRQTIKLDLSFSVNAAVAAQDDRLSSTVDYDELLLAVYEYAERSYVQLIETFAEGLAQDLMRAFAIEWIRIRVHKPGALKNQAHDLSLTIERRLVS